MKGLIIKDLFALKKQSKILLMLIVFYTVFSFMTKNSSMLGAMVALMCVMMPITTMSYDESSKWDKYALSMPVSRKTIVLSKYILGIMIGLAGSIIVTPISVVMDVIIGKRQIGESLLMILLIGEVSIALLAFIFPILFKFGVEKGRMLMMIVLMVPFILLFIISKLGIKAPNEQTLKLLMFASPAIVVAILLLSIRISMGIYTKKEF